MENDNEIIEPVNNDGAAVDGSAKPKAQPVRRRTPKPLVEGINTPVGNLSVSESAPVQPAQEQPSKAAVPGRILPPKITLTSFEKQLIDGASAPTPPVSAMPKAVPFAASAPQKIELPKHNKARKVVWSLLLSLLAVSVVLGVYLWYSNRTGNTESGFANLVPYRAATPAVTANNTNPPAPIPDQLTASSSPATTTLPVATSSPVTASSSAVSAPAKTLTILKTPTGYLNVRSTPSTSGKLVVKVNPGDKFTYIEAQAGWYKINLPDGQTGWVTGQYVQVAH